MFQHSSFTAFTAKDRPLLQFFIDTKEDLAAWVEFHAQDWPGAYVKRGNRKVWSDQAERRAA